MIKVSYQVADDDALDARAQHAQRRREDVVGARARAAGVVQAVVQRRGGSRI